MSHARAVRIDLAPARTIVDWAIAHARRNDGAVGVSGHLPDDDEACAIPAITDCDLRADPRAADPT
jgi:hypothetical protein